MSFKKKSDLRLRKLGYGRSSVRHWALQLVTRCGNKVICSVGYPYVEYDFVVLMMELGGFDNLLIQDHEPGACWSLRRGDINRLYSIMNKETSYTMFNRIIEKTIQREQYLNYPLIRHEYENARNMLRAIRAEIYTLFRYFSDSALKQAALSALGSSKKVNNDTVRLQQVINRILNYNEEMAACVDKITDFEKSFESDNDYLYGNWKYGSGRGDKSTITLTDVLERINTARIAYYQRTNGILN